MKRIKNIFALTILSLFLFGCMKLDYGVTVQEDGSMQISITELLNMTQINDIVSQFDESWESISATDIINIEQSTESITSPFGVMENVVYEEITKTINEEEWSGVNLSGDLIEEDVKKLLVIDGSSYTLTLPVESLKKEIDSLYADLQSQLSSEDYDTYASSLEDVAYTLTVTMPYKATCPVGEVKNNTVVIDLVALSDASEDIVITCSKYNVPLYVGLGAGAVFLVVVLISSFKKKV